MSAKKLFPPRTWVEISRAALRANIRTFRKLIGPKVKLWSVVKSNAYGHGIFDFAKIAEKEGVDGFCVDSLVEAVHLRDQNIKNHIFVLGSTLPELFEVAAVQDITLSLSTLEDLKAFYRAKERPAFHLKLDTGMHRRGFVKKDLPQVLKILREQKKKFEPNLRGIYTHFAAAKDRAYPGFAEEQYVCFEAMKQRFQSLFPGMMTHVAATGGTMLGDRYHRDAVRVGMGLYGYHASAELEAQLPQIVLQPVLSWKTIITEVKEIRAGDYVGYNLTERLRRATRIAILPVGYWNGFPVALSRVGEVAIRGRRARVLGRVSMDIVVVDATGIPCRVGDIVTLIGSDGKEHIDALEIASRMPATHHYEVLTRLNPLMERRVV
ncbi:MAG: alanine racemase [Patescibacteria group bacterium]